MLTSGCVVFESGFAYSSSLRGFYKCIEACMMSPNTITARWPGRLQQPKTGRYCGCRRPSDKY